MEPPTRDAVPLKSRKLPRFIHNFFNLLVLFTLRLFFLFFLNFSIFFCDYTKKKGLSMALFFCPGFPFIALAACSLQACL